MGFKDIFQTKSIQAILLSATFLIPSGTTIGTAPTPDYASNIITAQIETQLEKTTKTELPTISASFAKTPRQTTSNPAIKQAVSVPSVNQTTPISTANQTATSSKTAQPVLSDSISVLGRTIPIFYTNSTSIDAGNMVARYGEHLVFGHNSAQVFKSLPNLTIGATFTITKSGKTTTYRVESTETMEKSTVKNFMSAIADGRFRGNRYDIILMTCAGTSVGNGDATHRLLVFANPIN